jgi:hypothetical protein
MDAWVLVSELTGQETFAEGSGIRELARLNRNYGGKHWRKRTGFARIRMTTTGETCMAELRMAELHWYEAHGVGKVEMKIKELL